METNAYNLENLNRYVMKDQIVYTGFFKFLNDAEMCP